MYKILKKLTLAAKIHLWLYTYHVCKATASQDNLSL